MRSLRFACLLGASSNCQTRVARAFAAGSGLDNRRAHLYRPLLDSLWTCSAIYGRSEFYVLVARMHESSHLRRSLCTGEHHRPNFCNYVYNGIMHAYMHWFMLHTDVHVRMDTCNVHMARLWHSTASSSAAHATAMARPARHSPFSWVYLNYINLDQACIQCIWASLVSASLVNSSYSLFCPGRAPTGGPGTAGPARPSPDEAEQWNWDDGNAVMIIMKRTNSNTVVTMNM